MKAFISILSLLLIFLSNQSMAYVPKEGNISAIFGPFFFQTRSEGSSSGATSPLQNDLGLMLIGDISDHGSLELALFHMDKYFFRQENGLHIAEKTQVMHITMGYRWWLSEIWSTSMAIYSAYGMGDPQVMHSDFTSNPIDTSAQDTTEYGFDFATQAEFWSSGRYAALIDARYSFSVTKKQNEDADHYGVMLALRYFIQEKQREVRRK